MLVRKSITCSTAELFIEELRFKLCAGWRIIEIKVEKIGDRNSYVAYIEQK